MKLRLIFAFFIATIAIAVGRTNNITVIPEPVSLQETGETFKLSKRLSLHVDAALGSEAEAAVDHFCEFLRERLSLTLQPTAEAQAMLLVKHNTGVAPEGYELRVGNKGIVVEACDAAGVFYALQTLRQLLPVEVQAGESAQRVTIPGVSISDTPRYRWRGMMLDESRHFFGVAEVKRILDLMARYKLNRFHWHLTDDQGWRIQSTIYPLLNRVGSWRKSIRLHRKSERPDGQLYGGLYSFLQIKEIIAYAKERFIEVVPEIDMPGHVQAAVASYPDMLTCNPGPFEVWTGMGISNYPLHVLNPRALEFMTNVVGEVAQVFSSDYIHLGGDECPMHMWKISNEYSAWLLQHHTDNYYDIQTWFYRQLLSNLQRHPVTARLKPIYWNESLEGQTTDLGQATIMVWTDVERAAQRAADADFDIVLSPQIPFYINRRQSKLADEPDTQGLGNETLEAVYNYTPLAARNTKGEDKVIGLQANCWTEFIQTAKTLEYLILPRLAAVAEAAWTPQAQRSYSDFLPRIKHEASFYDRAGFPYGKAALQ